jgi:hypothetical protein
MMEFKSVLLGPSELLCIEKKKMQGGAANALPLYLVRSPPLHLSSRLQLTRLWAHDEAKTRHNERLYW